MKSLIGFSKKILSNHVWTVFLISLVLFIYSAITTIAAVTMYSKLDALSLEKENIVSLKEELEVCYNNEYSKLLTTLKE